ncbi:hypothetical protein X943_000497 [Babesia divergens]|uniref:Uncharacterized protein n=1 Tax=Babesia divergens TaxID=32595 RepID=A0AAD9GF12_BABDI|nr:hypothetical protein X943_000497 [Babesia divergens]
MFKILLKPFNVEGNGVGIPEPRVQCTVLMAHGGEGEAGGMGERLKVRLEGKTNTFKLLEG